MCMAAVLPPRLAGRPLRQAARLRSQSPLSPLTFLLKINSGRVWDYTRDRYVHHLPSATEASAKDTAVSAGCGSGAHLLRQGQAD